MNSKSFLDMDGLTYLLSYFQNYPNNEILGTVINAIDSAKADRTIATQSENGLMSKLDKIALDNLNVAAKTLLLINNRLEITITDAYNENVNQFILQLNPNFGETVLGKNHFNKNTEILGYFLSASGSPTKSEDDAYSDLIPVDASSTYYVYGYHTMIGVRKSFNKRIHGYDSNGTWVMQLSVCALTETLVNAATEPIEFSTSFSIPSNVSYIRVSHRQDDANIMVEKGLKTEYEEYIEINPISPYSSVTVYNTTDSTLTDINSENITFSLNIWSGTVNLLTGTITSEYAQIASYNGENLPGIWYSDRDIYAEGTIPSQGAQVIYKLAQPITFSFSPLTYATIIGFNKFWVNTGMISSFIYYSRAMSVDSLVVNNGSIKIGNTVLSLTQLQSLLNLI